MDQKHQYHLSTTDDGKPVISCHIFDAFCLCVACYGYGMLDMAEALVYVLVQYQLYTYRI